MSGLPTPEVAREELAMDQIDAAVSWLSEPGDPGTVATAQAHATLAVAYALTALLASRRAVAPEPPLGNAGIAPCCGHGTSAHRVEGGCAAKGCHCPRLRWEALELRAAAVPAEAREEGPTR